MKHNKEQSMTECPNCGENIRLKGQIRMRQIVTCGVCNEALQVILLSPLTLVLMEPGMFDFNPGFEMGRRSDRRRRGDRYSESRADDEDDEDEDRPRHGRKRRGPPRGKHPRKNKRRRVDHRPFDDDD